MSRTRLPNATVQTHAQRHILLVCVHLFWAGGSIQCNWPSKDTHPPHFPPPCTDPHASPQFLLLPFLPLPSPLGHPPTPNHKSIDMISRHHLENKMDTFPPSLRSHHSVLSSPTPNFPVTHKFIYARKGVGGGRRERGWGGEREIQLEKSKISMQGGRKREARDRNATLDFRTGTDF